MTNTTLSILSTATLTTGMLLLSANAGAQVTLASQPETAKSAARMAISIEVLPLTAALNKWAEQTG